MRRTKAWMLSNNVTNISNAQKFAISINLLRSRLISIDPWIPCFLRLYLSGRFRLLAYLDSVASFVLILFAKANRDAIDVTGTVDLRKERMSDQ